MSLCSVDLLAGQLLGRHVGRRAAADVLGRARSPTAARPKSMIRTSPAPSSMMLAGLRSRCSTPLACAAASPAHSLRAISSALIYRQPSDAAQQRGEILAVDVLHRQNSSPSLRRCRRRDRRSGANLPRHADLVVEPREGAVVGAQRRQELQRDRLAELEVVGAVDLAHAAAPEQPDDAEAIGE